MAKRNRQTDHWLLRQELHRWSGSDNIYGEIAIFREDKGKRIRFCLFTYSGKITLVVLASVRDLHPWESACIARMAAELACEEK